jgi:hypothetical protein
MGKIADATRTWGLGQAQRQQVIAFDTELEETQAERDVLKAKNLQLKALVEPLQQQVERLKERIEEETAKTARAEKLGAFKADKRVQAEKPHLGDTEIEVLKFVAACVLHDKSSRTEDVTRFLKTNQIRAGVILRRMSKAEYIWCHSSGQWRLNDKGQEYLVDHEIL